ncbi:MAG: hypothetical protein MZV64_40920 [Ignavibacteriales bacterium]|nr:hypothetical protein [Ignavibacteriales bacterium]
MLLFLIAYFFTDMHLNKVNPNAGYVQVFTQKGNLETVNFEKNINPEKEEKIVTEKEESTQEEAIPNAEPTVAVNFLDQYADTTSLEQIYSESSLNVSMKYPVGWTFIDQNVDKKLDGVTFWASASNFNPPPYVHLEVCDKNLFNQSRYKHNLQLRDAVVYFNDPENLANYFSQTFYFRTENKEDFSLKLTIKGEQAFKSYAPTFYGMLKSFRFGNSLF